MTWGGSGLLWTYLTTQSCGIRNENFHYDEECITHTYYNITKS